VKFSTAPARLLRHRCISELGVGTAETVRKWVRRAEMDVGARPGVTSQESAEVRTWRAEVRELRQADETSHAALGQAAADSVRQFRVLLPCRRLCSHVQAMMMAAWRSTQNPRILGPL
jgi:transposase-like protein